MMKKVLIFVLCFCGHLMPAWACSSAGPSSGTYEVKDGEVYYHGNGARVLVEGVDIATLGHLEKESARGIEERYRADYVTDKKHVYYQGQVLEGINPTQAVLLKQSFDQVILIEGFDQYVSREDRRKWDGYVKDEERVYYYGRPLEGANGASFEWLPFHEGNRRYTYGHNRDYARDGLHIYMYGQKVAGAAKTAHEIGYGYYLDAEHIYFRGEVLEGALPSAFEVKGVFIVSNGHVYYRAQQLALDAESFQVLKHMDDYSIIACKGNTYAGSFVKDRHGSYALRVTGELTRLDMAATDQQAYAYEEIVRLDGGWIMGFYKDDHFIYFFSNTAERSGSLESLYRGDTKTLDTFAALKSNIVFRDQTGFYFSKYRELIRVIDGDAKLVCLQADRACLLSGNKLSYVFNDGTVEQVQVNAQDLQCIKEGASLPVSLFRTTAEGMCFDRRYFYNTGEHKSMPAGGYEEALPYAITATELEQKRVESLKRIRVERKPLLIEEKPESDAFARWYVM